MRSEKSGSKNKGPPGNRAATQEKKDSTDDNKALGRETDSVESAS
jgi:hypothetical protein